MGAPLAYAQADLSEPAPADTSAPAAADAAAVADKVPAAVAPDAATPAADTAAPEPVAPEPATSEPATPDDAAGSITSEPGGLVVPGLRLSPQLTARPGGGQDDTPAFTESDNVRGEGQDVFHLEGNAQIRRNDTILKGDSIDYQQNDDEIEALGNVRLLRDGNLITGPHLKMNLTTGVGQIDNPKFHFGLTGASGTADSLELLGQNRARFKNVTYTACSCEKPSWEVRAKQLDVDYNIGEAVGHNGVLYFKDVPILASPVLSFPINNTRKSGFLSPTFGTTNKSGPELLTPYYFNIAPNRDATLYPKYMERRGMQLGGEFRYLEPTFSGITRFNYLPDDQVYKGDRYLFSSQHSQQLTSTLGLNWNINKVSDDAYFRDLSVLGTGLASTATLERSAALTWREGYWDGFVRAVTYQTLQDPLAPIVPPYDRAPQIHLNGARYDWHGFDLKMEADVTRFTSPDLPSGSRAYLYPSIAYPIIKPGGFFIPKIGVNTTKYYTDSFQGTPSSDPSRTVPIMSVDTGLIFERDTHLLGNAVKQTLEPRLYYLRVPYRNQNNLPIYDTALADFNFAQIFSENIYSGVDRIAEANQLTAGLTSRWLDPKTGVERASVTAAQRLYFSDQRVSLPGEEQPNDGRSDFLVSVYGALTSTLSGQTMVQYSPQQSRVTRSTVGARWSPQRLSTISLAYRYNRTQFDIPGEEQIDIAFQWPLAKSWYAIGRFNYSLLEHRVAESVAGIEYNGGCCWAARVVAQTYAVATQNTTTAMFFQLELTGFGGIGSSPIDTLRRSIPGYQVINPPPEPGTGFERYE